MHKRQPPKFRGAAFYSFNRSVLEFFDWEEEFSCFVIGEGEVVAFLDVDC